MGRGGKGRNEGRVKMVNKGREGEGGGKKGREGGEGGR